MLQIEVCNRQSSLTIDPVWLRRVVTAVLEGEGVHRAEISLAVVSNDEIHRLNRRFLQHDEATDVLSFQLQSPAEPLEGEVVVSAEMAQVRCHEFGWSASDELTLYVVHGTLHLVGYLDGTAEQKARMRARESDYLTRLGVLRKSLETDRLSQPAATLVDPGESNA